MVEEENAQLSVLLFRSVRLRTRHETKTAGTAQKFWGRGGPGCGCRGEDFYRGQKRGSETAVDRTEPRKVIKYDALVKNNSKFISCLHSKYD